MIRSLKRENAFSDGKLVPACKLDTRTMYNAIDFHGIVLTKVHQPNTIIDVYLNLCMLARYSWCLNADVAIGLSANKIASLFKGIRGPSRTVFRLKNDVPKAHRFERRSNCLGSSLRLTVVGKVGYSDFERSKAL
jgi:hypothetical protein